MLGGGSFSFFPRSSGPDVGEAGEAWPRKEERKNDLHDRKGRKKTVFFFKSFFYICWFREIQIFMVNGSSRDLFKMHCAWNLYVIF